MGIFFVLQKHNNNFNLKNISYLTSKQQNQISKFLQHLVGNSPFLSAFGKRHGCSEICYRINFMNIVEIIYLQRNSCEQPIK
jgi:hypothetical protein